MGLFNWLSGRQGAVQAAADLIWLTGRAKLIRSLRLYDRKLVADGHRKRRLFSLDVHLRAMLAR